MKIFKWIAVILLCSIVVAPAWGKDLVTGSVVKLYCIRSTPDYLSPWQMAGLNRGTGSGCIIDGKRILTNAHVVSNQTFIQVRKAGDATKYVATVELVAHECDLAIVRVDDDNFFTGARAVDIGNLADIRDSVAVYGFPKGGEELAITEGVVSRIEHRRYTHSSATLLTCQMDAAINPGSSGGPVIKKDKIVGVAFQGGGGENIGYMVPAPIIKHLLRDIEDGAYDGTPDLGIYYQEMENPDLRKKNQMSEEETGVLVAHLLLDYPAGDKLQIGDVILSVDGTDIANDGTIALRNAERTSWEYRVQQKQLRDFVTLTVLRAGEKVEIDVGLNARIDHGRLVPHEQYDVLPTYYITGGLVFEPLTANYLKRWGKNWFTKVPIELTNYYVNGFPTEDRREVVVLIRVLGDVINVGYQGMENSVIVKVNGNNISTMGDLVPAFEQHTGRYHTIVDEKGRTIVLEKAKAEERNDYILKKYKVDCRPVARFAPALGLMSFCVSFTGPSIRCWCFDAKCLDFTIKGAGVDSQVFGRPLSISLVAVKGFSNDMLFH